MECHEPHARLDLEETLSAVRSRALVRSGGCLIKEKTATDRKLKGGFSHNETYRSVSLNGRSFSLTPNQAIVVETLHFAWKEALPDVSLEQIADRIGRRRQARKNLRLRDIFKGNRATLDALIATGGSKGTYRINIPE